MGHMDNDNDERHTVTVRWKTDSTPEVFHGATNVDNNGDEISFDDNNGKHHDFSGVSFHIVAE
jgi:hypothetical protein